MDLGANGDRNGLLRAAGGVASDSFSTAWIGRMSQLDMPWASHAICVSCTARPPSRVFFPTSLPEPPDSGSDKPVRFNRLR